MRSSRWRAARRRSATTTTSGPPGRSSSASQPSRTARAPADPGGQGRRIRRDDPRPHRHVTPARRVMSRQPPAVGSARARPPHGFHERGGQEERQMAGSRDREIVGLGLHPHRDGAAWPSRAASTRSDVVVRGRPPGTMTHGRPTNRSAVAAAYPDVSQAGHRVAADERQAVATPPGRRWRALVLATSVIVAPGARAAATAHRARRASSRQSSGGAASTIRSAPCDRLGRRGRHRVEDVIGEGQARSVARRRPGDEVGRRTARPHAGPARWTHR